MRSKNADILEDVRKTGDLTDATAAKLKGAVDGYAKTFVTLTWSGHLRVGASAESDDANSSREPRNGRTRWPSLKDMRVRIASTKATQKITKAMQMVAASKLRRAQAAAEAARPYAERMEKVLGNIAATVADIDSAPRLLAGTGQDQVHLLVVCTAERGLCGAFNSSIVRLARERINRADRGRQDGEDPLRRPQGRRPASPAVRVADRRGDRAAR